MIWFFPDSQQEQSGQKDYRQILPQDRFWGQTAEKTACNKGHRHSHKPQKNPLCEQGAVLDIDDANTPMGIVNVMVQPKMAATIMPV